MADILWLGVSSGFGGGITLDEICEICRISARLKHRTDALKVRGWEERGQGGSGVEWVEGG
jgi:hypothetical protein